MARIVKGSRRQQLRFQRAAVASPTFIPGSRRQELRIQRATRNIARMTGRPGLSRGARGALAFTAGAGIVAAGAVAEHKLAERQLKNMTKKNKNTQRTMTHGHKGQAGRTASNTTRAKAQAAKGGKRNVRTKRDERGRYAGSY